MTAMAQSLGAAGEQDFARYTEMLPVARAAYHETFFNKSSGSYGPQQTANVLPLALNLVPAEHVASVVKELLGSLFKVT